MRNTASLHLRPSVRGDEPHPTRGGPVNAKHSGSTGVNLEKQSPILWCGVPCLWDEWQRVNLS